MAAPDRLDELRIDRSEPDPESPWARRALLLVASIVLVAAAAWWFLAGGQAVEVDTAIAVETGGGGGGGSVLDASGYVVARRQATVSSKVTGRLHEVAIEEGMKVKKDDVLARLDDSNARRALELAEARVAAAKSALAENQVRLHEAALTLRRTRELTGSGVASQSALDEAVAEHDSFAARLAAARDDIAVAERETAVRRQDLEDTLIRAPFDGVVISKDAQPGEIVSPMSAGGGFTRTGIGTIVDMNSLEVEVDVNEAFIQRVQPSQPVVATLDAYPDWKIPAHVITTLPAADREKATVKVRIAFDELGDPRILADMGVKVSFKSAPDPASKAPPAVRLVIPQRAVRGTGEAAHVFVVRDERAQQRAVSVGVTTGNEVEIVTGLRAGETVVVDPPAELADGSPVKARARREKG